MNKLRVLAFLVALVGVASLAHAADKVTCYTMWDDRFLYAAFEVQDPDLQSTNTSHMSNPWEDDAIELFFETDAQRAANRTPSTYQMSVSAGGGSNWQIGESGQPKPKTIFTFKFAKKIQGTLNSPYDTDMGYTLEVAIPWSEMGGPPKPGQVMGFNVICRMKGENDGFVSLSPEVKAAQDIQTPAKWSKIKFVDTPTIIAVQDGAVVSRRVVNQSPSVNGSLGPGEWIRDMRFVIAKPAPVKPARQQFAIEKLSLTPYLYSFQQDTRREAPVTQLMTDHPMEGLGPWFSYDRVQWHKDQLAGIQQAGIDVVLPVYKGSAAAKTQYASKGLSCMVQALKELKAEGKSYPLVGMSFDTASVSEQYGGKADLKTDEVKGTFYGMIKDFFLHVPDEFRATMQLPEDKGGRPACIVVIPDTSAFSDFDGTFVDYCNKRFDEDFGRKLVWIGSLDSRAKAKVMDGYTQYGGGKGLIRDNTGWLDVATIGAGYDDSGISGKADIKIRPRLDGEVYKKDWNSLVSLLPNWVIVDGWNSLQTGSEVCPSAEYGTRYPFLTKINLLRFNGMRPYDAKFLKHDTPQSMVPGAIYQVTLTVKNAGTKIWYPGNQGVFLTARWFKDGSLYADTSVRLPLQDTVLAGHVMTKTIGIRTVDQDGKPLAEGTYELRWEMVRANDEWFATGGDAPLSLPIKISASAPAGFTVVSSDLPSLMKSGATYSAKLKIRNDGPTPWKAGSQIGYRIYKSSVQLGKDSVDSTAVVTANEAAATLAAEVQPGRVVEITVPVSGKGSDGAPLPAWMQSDLWTYMIRWDVNDGSKWLASSGIGAGAEVVKILAADSGPRFVKSDTPDEMVAGKAYPVIITLQNTGSDTWTAADTSIGYHWYYLDGTEVVWDGKKTSLSADILAGQQADVKASVTPPPFDGQYLLVWDLAIGDKWASTSANTRGGDTLTVPVSVVKGRLVVVDMDKLFDTDVISFDAHPNDGDADGSGMTLAGEYLPPMPTLVKNGALWSSGLWMPGSGLDSSKHISFKYPSKADGAKNAVACKGQTIEVKSGKYVSAHLLVLAMQKVPGAGFTANYGTTSAPAQADFASWTEAPSAMQTALVCPHRHSASGDQPGQKCYLVDYAMPSDPKADLTSINLPNNPALKVMAITLEKAQ